MHSREGYADQPLITVDERKAIELGLLEKFDVFARQHGLTYWLFWGTLLGAVRHEGFIPWDDDVDVAMPQKDYLRLVELMRQQPDAIEGARLNAFELDEGYTRPFAKLCDTRTVLFEDFDIAYVEEGVYMDIFPLIPAPASADERASRRKRWRKDMVLSGLSRGPLVKHRNPVVTLAKMILRPYARMRGYKTFLTDICGDVDCVERDFGASEYVLSAEETATQFESAWFESTVDVPFEHLHLPAPGCWDAVLTHYYGDYRQLPPEDQRRCHASTAYWKQPKKG